MALLHPDARQPVVPDPDPGSASLFGSTAPAAEHRRHARHRERRLSATLDHTIDTGPEKNRERRGPDTMKDHQDGDRPSADSAVVRPEPSRSWPRSPWRRLCFPRPPAMPVLGSEVSRIRRGRRLLVGGHGVDRSRSVSRHPGRQRLGGEPQLRGRRRHPGTRRRPTISRDRRPRPPCGSASSNVKVVGAVCHQRRRSCIIISGELSGGRIVVSPQGRTCAWSSRARASRAQTGRPSTSRTPARRSWSLAKDSRTR